MIISNINSTNVFSSLLKVFGRKNLYKEANMYSIVVGVDELNIILNEHYCRIVYDPNNANFNEGQEKALSKCFEVLSYVSWAKPDQIKFDHGSESFEITLRGREFKRFKNYLLNSFEIIDLGSQMAA